MDISTFGTGDGVIAFGLVTMSLGVAILWLVYFAHTDDGARR